MNVHGTVQLDVTEHTYGEAEANHIEHVYSVSLLYFFTCETCLTQLDIMRTLEVASVGVNVFTEVIVMGINEIFIYV